MSADFHGAQLTINFKAKKQGGYSSKEQTDKDCWFCFDNEIDRHLIFHETENLYCALPKGGVNKDHYLIVPKKHLASQVEILENPEMKQELLALKATLIKSLEAKNLDYLIFERFVPFSFKKA